MGKKIGFLVLVLIVFVFGFWLGAKAETNDVGPYLIAEIPNPWTGQFQVRKMVYQGCELFIVSGGPHDAVAITTGRGCK